MLSGLQTTASTKLHALDWASRKPQCKPSRDRQSTSTLFIGSPLDVQSMHLQTPSSQESFKTSGWNELGWASTWEDHQVMRGTSPWYSVWKQEGCHPSFTWYSTQPSTQSIRGQGQDSLTQCGSRSADLWDEDQSCENERPEIIPNRSQFSSVPLMWT